MTDAALQQKIPLGVGSIISGTFSTIFRNIASVLLILLVPVLVQFAFSSYLIGVGDTLGTSLGEPNENVGNVTDKLYGSMGMILLGVIISGIATALLVQLAYDSKLGRPIRLSQYIGPAVTAVFPITVLSTIVGLLAGIATLALIIPGLWVSAVFSVVVPAIVIEKAGFGGLNRSAVLTKKYRWPIVGVLVLVGICAIIPIFLSMAFSGVLISAMGNTGIYVAIAIYLILNALSMGLGGTSVALIYARLREIKEGLSVDQIAAVFD